MLILILSTPHLQKDLEFEEWEERKEDANLLMRDFHYTRPNSGVGPKEVYCEGQHRSYRRAMDPIDVANLLHRRPLPENVSMTLMVPIVFTLEWAFSVHSLA